MQTMGQSLVSSMRLRCFVKFNGLSHGSICYILYYIYRSNGGALYLYSRPDTTLAQKKKKKSPRHEIYATGETQTKFRPLYISNYFFFYPKSKGLNPSNNWKCLKNLTGRSVAYNCLECM